MKRILLAVAIVLSSSLIGIAASGVFASIAAAQNYQLQHVNNALAFPRSSERFFDAGRQQIDQEVQRLRQGSNEQTTDLLDIDPTILQQQQNLQPPEQQFLDEVGAPHSTLPIELLDD
jgi:hypothetical protein